jgi:hypothetical protein
MPTPSLFQIDPVDTGSLFPKFYSRMDVKKKSGGNKISGQSRFEIA